MNVSKFGLLALVCTLGLHGLASAQDAKQPAAEMPAAAPAEAPQLPPGWTAADLQAFVQAATPGKMHERLVADVGVWHGKNTMWMGPGTEPIKSDSVSTITAIMDGRFTRCDMKGNMPGMGPYNGLMIAGYDNITEKFVSTWVDNMSTSFANGEGELSKDGKTLTWTFACNCPLTKKPINMRQVETVTGPGTKTLEMFGTDPKSGEEYQMMRIELTKAK